MHHSGSDYEDSSLNLSDNTHTYTHTQEEKRKHINEIENINTY